MSKSLELFLNCIFFFDRYVTTVLYLCRYFVKFYILLQPNVKSLYVKKVFHLWRLVVLSHFWLYSHDRWLWQDMIHTLPQTSLHTCGHTTWNQALKIMHWHTYVNDIRKEIIQWLSKESYFQDTGVQGFLMPGCLSLCWIAEEDLENFNLYKSHGKITQLL